jgi:hypothetical protein
VHWSDSVQRLPSLHSVPFCFGTAMQPPASTLQVPVLHAFVRFEQFRGDPAHRPPVQMSETVQALPSSHPVPFWTGTVVHWPVSGLHCPLRHSSFDAEQSTGVPEQTPFVHWSEVVQSDPSLHSLPFSTAIDSQLPLSGLHCPRVHALPEAEQSTGVPAQTPFVHWSFVVQALPSSQPVPLRTTSWSQSPRSPLQKPTWHASVNAEQSLGSPPQKPSVHESLTEQPKSSLHAVPFSFGTDTQPPST